MKTSITKNLLPLFLLLAAPLYGADYAPETPFIHVMGEAKTAVAPDEMALTFNLNGVADSYAAALKSTDAKFAQFLAFFDAQKIGRDAITSYEIDVRADREDRDSSSDNAATPPKTTYYANRKMEILLKDLKQFPPVYDEILSLESEGEVDVQFKTSQEDELKKKLLLVAADDAKQKAQELCDSFGMEIDGVHAISEQSFSAIENNFRLYGSNTDNEDGMMTGAGGGGGGREYFGPKTIDCTSDVFVIFTIQKKK